MICIVLPAYNEAENITALLLHIKSTLGVDGYRVVVVNDGSKDNTAALALSLNREMPIEVQENPVNMGLAETLKRGLIRAVELATGEDDVIITMDADNSQTPSLIPRMTQTISEGSDVVIASRYRYGAHVRGLSFSRKLMSYGASALFQTILPIEGVRDFTCGFRAYRASLLRRVFAELGPDGLVSERGFSCMVDILLKLRQFDPIITEVPLVLRYDKKLGQSKMKVLSTVQDTLKLIIRRRLNISR